MQRRWRRTDDINSALGSVLSDPESLKQLQELADMLKAENGGEDPQPQQNTSENGGTDYSALASMLGSMAGSSPPKGSSGDGIDLDSVIKLMQAVSAAGGDDKDRRLLMALRPHVSTDKQEKIDRAVRLLKLYAVVNSLKDSGMLGQLDKLI